MSFDDHHVPADPHLEAMAQSGCEESRMAISRRNLLGVSAGLFSWSMMPRMASAATTDPRLLVVVLRGGMDGLNTVVPYGDSLYASARTGNLAISTSAVLKLDGFFGLHPAMKNFAQLFASREALVVHATAPPLQNRSHFACQDNLESGLPGSAQDPTGWMNRLLTALPAGDPIRMAGALHVGNLPLIMRGPAPVMGWSPPVFPEASLSQVSQVLSLYGQTDPTLATYLKSAADADELAADALSSVSLANTSSLRKSFIGAATLLRHPTGPRIAVMSVDGWDMHALQGRETGQLADRLGELDRCLAEFKLLAGDTWHNTAVLVVTEFGRTVRLNGTGGTDHGVGTVALLAGGAVAGGRVVSRWPGLSASAMVDGRDLRATTDLRSVFKGVLRDHLGVPSSILEGSVFPDSALAAPALSGLVA